MATQVPAASTTAQATLINKTSQEELKPPKIVQESTANSNTVSATQAKGMFYFDELNN